MLSFIAESFYFILEIKVFIYKPIQRTVDKQILQTLFIFIDSKTAFVETFLADNLCWIKGYSLSFSFLLPFGLLLLFNLLMFMILIAKLTCKKQEVSFSNFFVFEFLLLETEITIEAAYFLLHGLTPSCRNHKSEFAAYVCSALE